MIRGNIKFLATQFSHYFQLIGLAENVIIENMTHSVLRRFFLYSIKELLLAQHRWGNVIFLKNSSKTYILQP